MHQQGGAHLAFDPGQIHLNPPRVGRGEHEADRDAVRRQNEALFDDVQRTRVLMHLSN